MSRRGAVHTIDAFLASLVLIATLIYTVQVPVESVRSTGPNLEVQGYQMLSSLDVNGTLGKLIESRSWTELTTVISVCLPHGVSYNLTILDENYEAVNDRIISNSGLKGIQITSIEYNLALSTTGCPLYKVRLQLGS
jgi:hypothetical protein